MRTVSVIGQLVSWGGFLTYLFEIPSPLQGKSAQGVVAFMTSAPVIIALCIVGIVVTGPLLWTSGWWWPWVLRNFKKDHRTQVGEEQEMREEQERKIYTLRTAQELFDEFKNRTDMEAQRLLQPHIGKWLVVEDVVKNVLEQDRSIAVLVGKRLGPTICLVFEKDWQQQLETLREGDAIMAEGRISEVDSSAMYLSNCEMLTK